MAKAIEITLGYGGGAFINTNGGRGQDWCWVFMNSGSLTKNITPSSYSAYDMDLYDENEGENRNVRNDIILGPGLVGFQGTLNFAITQGALNKLFNTSFIDRKSVFDVFIDDGFRTLCLPCCYWNSFSISGNPRQVLSGTLNFVSTNNQLEDFDIRTLGSSPHVTENPIHEKIPRPDSYLGFDEKLIEYWNTGAAGVESFSLNFTRETTPVYLNTERKTPAYIRCGKLNLTGNFSSWKQWENFDVINLYIANKKLEMSGYRLKDSSSFSFEGIDDTGKFEYSIKLFNFLKSSDLSWNIIDLSQQNTGEQ